MLGILLVVAFGGAALTYVLGKIHSKLRDVFAVLFSLAAVAIVFLLYGKDYEAVYFRFFDVTLVLRTNMLSWFFAVTIVVIGLLSVIYSLEYMKDQPKLDYYYFILLLINASMVGTVVSGDFVSFFVFWEVMSLCTFLLISYKGGKALFAGIKYIIMSIIGSVAMLAAIISFYVSFGSFEFSAIASGLQGATNGYIIFLLITFGLVFTIINAFWPLHTWLPDAHAEAVSPFSSVLSAVLVRKGLYGLYLVVYLLIGFNVLGRLSGSIFNFHTIFCWIGAITIVFAAFSAFLQNDSKRILAWSTVGQGGYMILGIAFTTSVGVAGGMMHVLNHCIYIALLFFVAGAIEHQTGGIRDINVLGGLIKKMPVTFIGGVVGIAGLIGVPLTCGFVSKWLIYKTLILEGHPFLAFAAFLGTWGTILYGYKFIHNVFLGQLPQKYRDVKEVPLAMQIPIVLLTVLVIFFGVFPGIALNVINIIDTAAGFEALPITLTGISPDAGALNTLNIFFVIIVVGIIVWLLLRKARKSVGVSQTDSYGAGSYIPVDRYNYTVEFYKPLSRMIAPYLRDFVDDFYIWLCRGVQAVADGLRRFYRGDIGYYVVYILLFLALLIFVQLRWGPW